MRILVPGYHPRVQQMADLMKAAGHDIVLTAEAAEAVMCCQSNAVDGHLERSNSLAMLSVLGPHLRLRCVICLVSVEPNIGWPVDFCHAASRTLGLSGATETFPVTRAHLQSLTPQDPAELILGAPTNDQETLRAIWQPVFPTQELSPILTVIDAEMAAEYKPPSRAGGAGMSIRFAVGQCSLGAILVAATGQGICAILMGDDPADLTRDLQDRFKSADLISGDADFENTIATVVGLVEAPALGLDLPLDIRGTAFQQRVWQALREIPPGETATYSEIAQRLDQPTAIRAVASACAANPLAIAIPCHRVVRTDDSLAGYRWGLERKRELLRRES